MSGARKSIEWPTLMLNLGAHVVWLAAGLCWQLPYGYLALPVLAVIASFHTSLQHETIHGHPTGSGALNELLVSLPLSVVFPYRRYRDLHLKHHIDVNLTDPFEDPESYFWPLARYQTMRPFMKRIFAINNTFVGRLLIGPVLSVIGFSRTEFALFKQGDRTVWNAWLLHVPGLVLVFGIVTQVFGMPVWVYLLFVVYPALSLLAMRSFAEHQAVEMLGGRSAIIESCAFFSLLYLNNNLHIVHHASPSTPWYDIPNLYRERRDHYLAANGNYRFRGYAEVARLFAFRVKQPVDHPFLHRQSGEQA